MHDPGRHNTKRPIFQQSRSLSWAYGQLHHSCRSASCNLCWVADLFSGLRSCRILGLKCSSFRTNDPQFTKITRQHHLLSGQTSRFPAAVPLFVAGVEFPLETCHCLCNWTSFHATSDAVHLPELVVWTCSVLVRGPTPRPQAQGKSCRTQPRVPSA